MSNRSKIVPENILKTGAIQVQQIKYGHIICIYNNKLSYRRETVRQLPTWRGASPSSQPPSAPLSTPVHMVESETRNKRTSSVSSTKRTLR